MKDSNEKIGVDRPAVSIIMLNWNGKQDTIDCLKSLSLLTYPNFNIILIDNASSDDSRSAIREYIRNSANSAEGRAYIMEADGKGTEDPIVLTFVENEENTGFAKGNNTGIRLALKKKADYILLLNNDTEVNPDFLDKMISFHGSHADTQVSCPQIRYFGCGEKIWNCGGRLGCMGTKEYYYEGKYPIDIKEKEYIPIQFITGCALFANSEVFEKYGLLSEAFFFGEEDYEFSLRMRKQGVKIACIIDAVIYHKVSSSVSRASDKAAGKVYIHYLNRFIDMRTYMNRLVWPLWKFAFLHYVVTVLMLRYRAGFGPSLRVAAWLWRNSVRLDSVNKTTFEAYFSWDFKGKPI